MAISKWLGGILILIAFIIAGRAQAADNTSNIQEATQASAHVFL